ncbi:MAG TPA: diacylglycerol kinase family protein [Ktedonobacteraceae bacterium]|nr:diacylglycerol kinase family protein [Ktedonobacteraceae bacterium]
MRCKRASLVINPRTGQNVAKLADVLAVCAAAGWKADIALKEYGGHTMELAEEAAEDGRDLVVAYGGDGTLNQVVNGVMNAKGQHSIVGVIPGGTVNVWAGEVSVPIDPVKAALSLVNSEPRKVDIGHVDVVGLTLPDTGQGGQEAQVPGEKMVKVGKGSKKAKHHFLLMAGLGIDAAIMGNVSKPLKYRIGPLAVGLSAAKELPTQRPFPVEIWSPQDGEPLWRGEALQVVVGNTRRYGDIAEMTPNAYIDDGVLDVCVITAGDPLSTLQQITSLLLRKKPDNLTAEYFHGSQLSISVPASVPMQLDGSTVKLKDYLNSLDYDTLQQARDAEHVMVTYRFGAMPHALEVAIPCTYDNTLFEQSGNVSEGKSLVKSHPRKDDEVPTTKQRHTEEEESVPSSQVHQLESHPQKQGKHTEDVQGALPELVNALFEDGRKVAVIGKAPDVEKKQTYIIAGNAAKRTTGEMRPVAVVVNSNTAVFNREGMQVSSEAIQELQEGATIIVEGKKSKRGVIQASRLVL